MKALVIIAHGSRRQSSNDEVKEIAVQLNNSHDVDYDMIKACFLEIAAPQLSNTVADCVAEGATSVVILPYFLNSGTHVVRDIPAIISQIKGKYPALSVSVTDHIGNSPFMLSMIKSMTAKK